MTHLFTQSPANTNYIIESDLKSNLELHETMKTSAISYLSYKLGLLNKENWSNLSCDPEDPYFDKAGCYAIIDFLCESGETSIEVDNFKISSSCNESVTTFIINGQSCIEESFENILVIMINERLNNEKTI